MKNLTNYHTHSIFCDGRAQMEEFVRFAISMGYSALGFSSHAPLFFSTHWSMQWDMMDDYLQEFKRLKEKYADRIELYIGLEIDYLNEDYNPTYKDFLELPLDFRIGSIHLLQGGDGQFHDIDTTAGHFRRIVDYYYDENLYALLKQYHENQLSMARNGHIDVVGHPFKYEPLAVNYDPFLLEKPYYKQMLDEFYTLVQERDLIVEVNTKAYMENKLFFPDLRLFPELCRRGIKVVVNSDAHYPERINNGRPEALKALYAAGYRKVMELHQGIWQNVDIDDSL